MNILFVISSLQIGGEQKVAGILTDGFVRKGHKVDLLVLNSKEEKQFSFNDSISIEYVGADKYKAKNYHKLRAILKKARSQKYDVVIGFAVIPAVLCSLLRVSIKTPVIVCERNDPAVYPIHFRAIRFFAYRFASGAVFQTRDASEYFSFIKGLNKVIIPNPIDIEKLGSPYEGKRNKRIVNTARLVDAKNQQMLIEAFSNIANKYPDYSVVIYGDGPNRESLQKKIDMLKMQERIILHEAIPGVLEVIKKDAIFVLCSNNEGFPNSLAEALALGIPSISTDCRIGGPKDMIVSGENGFLVDVGSVEQLQEKLDALLQDEELQNKFHESCLTIRNRLDKEIIIQRWLEYILTIKNRCGEK